MFEECSPSKRYFDPLLGIWELCLTQVVTVIDQIGACALPGFRAMIN